MERFDGVAELAARASSEASDLADEAAGHGWSGLGVAMGEVLAALEPVEGLVDSARAAVAAARSRSAAVSSEVSSDEVAPRRRTDRSSSTFRSLAWSPSDRSATSSRKIVPRFAAWKRPGLARRASVKAPRSNPNISASRSVSGIAAQLTSTNGP